MHYANHYYGHAHIFSQYVGMRPAEPLMIWGYLQHGWNVHDGFAIGTRFVPDLPLLVWSESAMRNGWSMGRRRYEVVGSAWSYLLDLDRRGEIETEPPPERRQGSIFYPFHGWEGQEVVGDHRLMLRRLLEVEDGPLTVCLYWTDYDRADVRGVYEEAGCRVITHGLRGYGYQRTDRRFLVKQLGELRRHRRVVSNRLCSAILYGASVGCEVGVYGDPMVLTDESPAYGGVERLRRRWPDLHQELVPGDLAREVARTELSPASLRTPAEIVDLFGWTRARRRTVVAHG